MASEQAPRDSNYIPTLLAVDDVTGETVAVPCDADGNLLIAATIAGGAGTVTDVSVVTANGVSGSVATSTTTPAITLTLGAITPTSVNGATITTTTGTLTLANGSTLATSGANSITLTSTGATNVTLPTTGTLATLTGSETFTNKTLISPTLTTPNLGVATTTSINKVAITAPATSATITIANGKTLTANNTLTLAGTDATVMTFPATSATIARTDAANTFTGASTASAWVLTSPTITTKISPTSNDGAPLGDTTHNFSDLFLATGAVINWNNGNVTLTHASNTLTFNAANITINSGDLAVTTPGTTSTSVLTTSGAQTLTNKRITKRTGTTTSSATPTINTDNVDFYSLTAQTVDITSFTTNLSGTPTEAQTLWIAITGTAARAITWGTSFEASTVALPTTTVTTNRLDVGFVWNTVTSKWRCVATA